MKQNDSASVRHRIGVISDTHGLLRPAAAEALEGCDRILHAGDIDTPDVLAQLEEIGPVTAVCGNMDFGPLRERLAQTEAVQIGALWVYMLHDLGRLDLDPVAGGFHLVISGHSHQPGIERRNGTLYLNPGSAGPRRPGKPVSMATLEIDDERIIPRIFDLDG